MECTLQVKVWDVVLSGCNSYITVGYVLQLEWGSGWLGAEGAAKSLYLRLLSFCLGRSCPLVAALIFSIDLFLMLSSSPFRAGVFNELHPKLLASLREGTVIDKSLTPVEEVWRSFCSGSS